MCDQLEKNKEIIILEIHVPLENSTKVFIS